MPQHVDYMARSREYYLAQGYATPYVWAHHSTIPFSRLKVPLNQASVALVTTASHIRANDKPANPQRTEIGMSDRPPGNFFTQDLAWDKAATHTDDLGSYFPLELLHKLAAEGEIGRVASRYYCLPSEYSQRKTLEEDGPAIVRSCLETEVAAVVLVPL